MSNTKHVDVRVEQLQPFIASDIPVSSCYLVKEWLSVPEADELLDAIQQYGKTKSWVTVSRRRLLSIGGRPHEDGMIEEPLPAFLDNVAKRIHHQFMQGAPFNHVLINWYSLGEGIMDHKDGPLYDPVVAIVSLQSPTVFHFRKPMLERETEADNIEYRLEIPPRSLFVFTESLYADWMHGIDDNDQLDTRYSLTIRRVPKVCKPQAANLLKHLMRR